VPVILNGTFVSQGELSDLHKWREGREVGIGVNSVQQGQGYQGGRRRGMVDTGKETH